MMPQKLEDKTNPLKGRVALVTGASRGLGRAAALALARAQVDVAVNFQHREAEAEAVCSEIRAAGRRAVAVRADVSKAAEVARLVETVERELAGIDILVNNAGISCQRSVKLTHLRSKQ